MLVVHDPNVTSDQITSEVGDCSAAAKSRQSRLCRILTLTHWGCRAALVLAVQAVWAFFFTANPMPEEHAAPPPTALRTLSFLAIVATPLLIPFCMPLLLSPLTLPLGIVAIYLLLWECGRAKVSGYAPAYYVLPMVMPITADYVRCPGALDTPCRRASCCRQERRQIQDSHSAAVLHARSPGSTALYRTPMMPICAYFNCQAYYPRS